MGGACSACWGDERRIEGFSGETWRKEPLGRPRHRWGDNIKMDVQEVGCGVWTGWSWRRIGTGCGHLWMRYWIFGLRKMRGISWLVENRFASQEGLCYMEWVSEWVSEYLKATGMPCLKIALLHAVSYGGPKRSLHGSTKVKCINLWAPWVFYIGQAFRYSPENAFYIFNHQIYFIIWYLLDRASLI